MWTPRFIAPGPIVTALVVAGIVLGARTLPAQMNTPPVLGIPPRPEIPRAGDDDLFRDNPELRDRLLRTRAIERQRRMIEDANRLVDLTAQYRTALNAHGTATADDQKLLLQIEKLARDLKDRMRGM